MQKEREWIIWVLLILVVVNLMITGVIWMNMTSLPTQAQLYLSPDGEICGNGIPEQGEGCDDGNTDNTDLCDTEGTAPNSRGLCMPTYCGDGVWQTSGNGDGYPSPSGDGVADIGVNEWCDDGNNDNLDGCSASCRLEGDRRPHTPRIGDRFCYFPDPGWNDVYCRFFGRG